MTNETLVKERTICRSFSSGLRKANTNSNPLNMKSTAHIAVCSHNLVSEMDVELQVYS